MDHQQVAAVGLVAVEVRHLSAWVEVEGPRKEGLQLGCLRDHSCCPLRKVVAEEP